MLHTPGTVALTMDARRFASSAASFWLTVALAAASAVVVVCAESKGWCQACLVRSTWGCSGAPEGGRHRCSMKAQPTIFITALAVISSTPSACTPPCMNTSEPVARTTRPRACRN